MPEDKAPGTFTVAAPKKRGPGRPAGATNKAAPTATAVNADVRQAMATLDSMYSMIGVGLGMFGMFETLGEWVTATEKLKAQNEDALKAAPKLAKFIANAGTTGGSATFLIAHGIAFASVAGVARTELAARAAQRERERPPQERDVTYVPEPHDKPADLTGYIPAPNSKS